VSGEVRYERVGSLDLLDGKEGCVVVLRRDGTRVALLRTGDGIVAFEALCPHAQGPLERGEIDGAVVTCVLHGWRFDLARGGCETHGYQGIRTYAVEVREQSIYIGIEG